MGSTEIVIVAVAAVVALLVAIVALGRLKRARGKADGVSQVLVSESTNAIWTVEQQSSGGGKYDSRNIPDGRISVRKATDGELTARVNVHGLLRVLGTDRNGNLVCTDPTALVHLRDPRTLVIVSNTDVIVPSGVELAPPVDLAPRIEDHVLSVTDRAGRRVALHDALGPIDPIPEPMLATDASSPADAKRAHYKLTGSPRARIMRGKSAIGEADFLTGRLFGELVDEHLVVASAADLETRAALITMVATDGAQRFAVPLERPIEREQAAFRCGKLMLLLMRDAPIELIAVDIASGRLAWRTSV